MPDARELAWRWVQALTVVLVVTGLVLHHPTLALVAWLAFMVAVVQTFRESARARRASGGGTDDRRAHIAWLPGMLAAGSIWLVQDTLTLWRRRRSSS